MSVADRVTPVVGLRFRDPWRMETAWSGLRVRAFHALREGASFALYPNPSGVYVLHDAPAILLAGGAGPGAENVLAKPRDGRWRIRVEDPECRFLSCEFPAWLPCGLMEVPLAPSPMRSAPHGFVVVRTHLVLDVSGDPVAHARLEALLDGAVVATGYSDARGSVQLAFPGPRPRLRPSGLPEGEPFDPLSWDVTFRLFRSPGADPSTPIDPSQAAGWSAARLWGAWDPALDPPGTPLAPVRVKAQVCTDIVTANQSSLFVAS